MMIFIVLIIGFGIYYIYKNSGNVNLNRYNEKNSEEVLKLRYVDGEIDDETYKRMLKILNN